MDWRTRDPFAIAGGLVSMLFLVVVMLSFVGISQVIDRIAFHQSRSSPNGGVCIERDVEPYKPRR